MVRVASRPRRIVPVLAGLVFFWAGSQWNHLPAGNGGAEPLRATAASSGLPGTVARATGAPPGLSAPLADAGEFAPQAALLLSARELAPCMPDVFRDIVRAVRGKALILCMTTSSADRQAVRQILRQAALPDDAVRFVPIPLDTMWVRDYGPFFVRRPDGGVWVLDMDYSPAGAGAEVRWRDNNAPRLLGEALGLPVEAVPLRLSGGNLLSNGDGLVVTTAAILRENADRGYTAGKIQSLLERHLGFSRWICLPELEGERTGHVDMYLTFPAENVAVVSQLDKSADPVNAEILDRAAEQLAGLPTRRGPMRVYRIPMEPGCNGVWRSYTNVVYANGVLLVPSFTEADQAKQAKAKQLYARLLPGWKIEGISCDDLCRSEGLLHCVCRNIPIFVPLAAPAGPDGTWADDCLDMALEPGPDGQRLLAGPGEILPEGFPGAAAALRPLPDATPTTSPADISNAPKNKIWNRAAVLDDRI
jgi:agmatine/peptidylarginine deiminase